MVVLGFSIIPCYKRMMVNGEDMKVKVLSCILQLALN
jgi:hypothetical protein